MRRRAIFGALLCGLGAVAAGADDAGTKPAELDPDKSYAKPKPLELPEGEPLVLSGPVLVLELDGMVNPAMGEMLGSAIRRAEREEAQAVLVELDTPGGLVSTTESMVQAILNAKVPVIVYVTPSGAHAASAGTMITMSGHVSAMSPATRIGAAHPVTGGGKDPESEGGEHMGKKVENDLAAFAKSIADRRGRNAEWAEDAVRHSVSITETRAVEIGVVDLVAADRAELLEALHGRVLMVGKKKVELATRGAATLRFEPSLRERVVGLLANPGVAMILGVLGMLGLMIEIYHPGLIVPGVLGVLCLVCSLIAMEQLPLDLGGAILALAGVGLLVAEIYASTFGVLGALGGVALTVGLVLLVDTRHPDFALDPSFRLTLGDVLPAVLTLAGFVAYVSMVVMRSQRAPPTTGKEALVGARGVALQPVSADGGMVFVSGEYWRARSEAPIADKAEVEVVEVDGLVLRVKARA